MLSRVQFLVEFQIVNFNELVGCYDRVSHTSYECLCTRLHSVCTRMDNLTVRAPEELLEEIANEAEDEGISQSAYVRECLRNRNASDASAKQAERKLAECKEQVNELEQEIDRLNRERRQLLEQRGEHTDLVRAVEQEQSLEERREKRKQSNVFRRTWWWLAGTPDNETFE